jgi:hypothetical protein
MRSNRISGRLRSSNLLLAAEIQEVVQGETDQHWVGNSTSSWCKSEALMESNTNRSLFGARMQFVSWCACVRMAVRMPRRAVAGRTLSACGSRRLRGPIPHRISSQGSLSTQLLEICGMARRCSRGSPWKVGDWICRGEPCRRRIGSACRGEKCAGPRFAGQEISGCGQSSCLQHLIYQRIGKEAPAVHPRSIKRIQRLDGSGHGQFHRIGRNGSAGSGRGPSATHHRCGRHGPCAPESQFKAVGACASGERNGKERA